MRSVALLLAGAVLAGACGTGAVDVDFEEPQPTLFADDEPTSSSTTTAPGVGAVDLSTVELPVPRGDVAGVVVLDGIAAPIDAADAGAWTIETPCGAIRSGTDPAPSTVLVVLDPAGDASADADPVAVARNHAIAAEVADRLDAAGVSALVTRPGDADVPATYRAAAGGASGALVFVSVALVDGDAEFGEGPALEVVHPAADTDGRRLAGLLHARVRPALETVSIGWPADVEPGVRAVLNQRGTDFFTVLRSPAEFARAVVHLPVDPAADPELFTSGPAADLFADAITDGIVRYLVTTGEGDGFVAPTEVVRNAPTASATEVCLDPLTVDP